MRILAWLFGSLLLAGAASGAVMAAWALADGRGDEAGWHALGLLGLPIGLLMISAARSGRDTAVEAIHAVARRARLLR